MNKHERLVELAKMRRSANWDGYANPYDYHSDYDSKEWVSPYSKIAHNVDAKVMLMLQDWASHDKLAGPFDESLAQLGQDRFLPTNVNIKRLLRDHLSLELADVFATNLFPFIKRGSMNANIPMRDLRRAALEFAYPQIEVVQPRIAVSFGLKTFNALRGVLSMGNSPSVEQAIMSPMVCNGTEFWCLAHPGQLGTNNRNSGDPGRVDRDWQQVAARLSEMEN